MSQMHQTLVVFFSGLAGGLVTYAVIRDPTSYAPFVGCAIGIALALFCLF